jgi:hypothetical protein
MRELDLSSLANIFHKPIRSGADRWVVRLYAEGLRHNRNVWGELAATLGLGKDGQLSHSAGIILGFRA